MQGFKEKYAVPAYVREGVEIKLQDVTFLVAIPSEANRNYRRKLASALSAAAVIDGEMHIENVTLDRVIELQQEIFHRECILDVRGWGGDFDVDGFLRDYPAGAEELYALAVDLANEEDEKAEAEAKKSSNTSTGTDDGQGKQSLPESLPAEGKSTATNSPLTSEAVNG